MEKETNPWAKLIVKLANIGFDDIEITCIIRNGEKSTSISHQEVLNAVKLVRQHHGIPNMGLAKKPTPVPDMERFLITNWTNQDIDYFYNKMMMVVDIFSDEFYELPARIKKNIALTVMTNTAETRH